jgi:low temperature requirement protein LtrA
MPRDPRDRGRAQRLALFIVIMLGEVCLAHVPSRRFRVAAAGAFVIIAGAAFCIAVIERRS